MKWINALLLQLLPEGLGLSKYGKTYVLQTPLWSSKGTWEDHSPQRPRSIRVWLTHSQQAGNPPGSSQERRIQCNFRRALRAHDWPLRYRCFLLYPFVEISCSEILLAQSEREESIWEVESGLYFSGDFFLFSIIGTLWWVSSPSNNPLVSSRPSALAMSGHPSALTPPSVFLWCD